MQLPPALRNPSLVVGAVITLAITFCAVFAPLLATHGSRVIDTIDVRAGEAFSGARAALIAAAAVGVLQSVTEQERLNVINARTLLYIQTFTITLIIYLVLSNFLSWVAAQLGVRVFHPPLVMKKRTRRSFLVARQADRT